MVRRIPTGSVRALIAEPHLFGFDVDRFLLAAVGAVAHQAFANHVSGYVDTGFAGAEGLQVFDDRRLRCVAGLQIEACRAETIGSIPKAKAS